MRDHCISPSACLRPTRNTAVFFRLIMAFALFFIGLTTEISGQVCYQQIKNNSGYPESTVSLTLETAACSLKTAVTAPFSSQFAVYSTAIYLHTAQTDQNVDPAIASILATVQSSSPYYLLFVKYGDFNSIYNDFRVYIKLPTTGIYTCLTSKQREELGSYIELATKSKYEEVGHSFPLYADAEKAGMEKLRKYLIKLQLCCIAPDEDCSLCPDGESAYKLRQYFQSHCFKKIPIEVVPGTSARPAEIVSQKMTNTAEIVNLTDAQFKFRHNDPEGSLKPVMTTVLNSDLFSEYSGGIKGFITSNKTFCSPGKLDSIIEDFENQNRDVSLWAHIWNNPEDESDQAYLFISALTEEGNLCAGGRPDLNSELTASFDIPNGEFVYNNRFEQSAAVVVATAAADCSNYGGATQEYPLASTSDLTGASLLCTGYIPGEYFFVAPSGTPVKLPKGSVVFFDQSVANQWQFDPKAIYGFVTAKRRWSGCGIKGNSFSGFYNFAQTTTAYPCRPLEYEGKAWFGFEETATSQRQIREGEYSPLNTDSRARGPLQQNFEEITYTSNAITQKVFTSYEIIEHLQAADFKACYTKKMEGTIAVVPNGNGTFTYYLIKVNALSKSEYWEYNCAQGGWVKLETDPFEASIAYQSVKNYAKYGQVIQSAYSTYKFVSLLYFEKPQLIHDALDFIGLILPLGDLANMVIYICEGSYGMAALSSFSVIPMVGDAGGFAKLSGAVPSNMAGKNAVHGIQYFDETGAVKAVLDIQSLYDNAAKELNGNEQLIELFLADASEKETKGLLGRTILESGNAEGLLKAWEMLANGPYRKSLGALEMFSDPAVIASRQKIITDGIQSIFPNLLVEELTAIRHYTTNAYLQLNAALRLGTPSEYFKSFEELLNNGLSKLPTYNGDKVFRGVYGEEAKLAKTWSIGEEINFKDFKSASTSTSVANGFTGDVFYEITNPKGKAICDISCLPGESELLFKSGSNFRVTNIVDNFVIYDNALNPMTVKKVFLEFVN